MIDDTPVNDEEILGIEFVDSGEAPTALSESAPAAAPGPEPAAGPESEPLRRELEELRDRHLRLAAEMENLKKRLQKERDEFLQFGLMNFLKEFLPILDNLKRAVEQGDPQDPLYEGLALILRQTEGLLARSGVTPVEAAEGAPFDPFFHEALSTQPTEGIDRPVLGKVFQTGYFLNSRLIRPALVLALVPPSQGGTE
jgi:molecular chaperone GrpE